MNPALPKNIEKLHESRKGGVKVIITYASAGAGHFRAAEAICDYLKNQDKGIDLKLVDILQKTNVLFKASYTFGYPFLINHAVFLWRLVFWVTGLKLLRRFTRASVSLIDRFNTGNFREFLTKENPDFIISTHFLPSAIATNLKRTGKINSRAISVVTDFGIHPFWISEGTDIYIVASSYTKQLLMLEGVEEERIKVLGIPIHPKFSRQYDRGQLSKKMGIEQNRFTVLVVTGSFGIGPVEGIVDLLHKDVQILVVCARNRRLFKRLKNKNYPSVRIFGFIENIQELMAVSDMIITKPGGMSISELLVMELVPIFISAIPGQETQNVEAMKRYGIGTIAKKPADIRSSVLNYRNNLDKLKGIKEKIKGIKKPFASQGLYNVICQGSVRAGS